MMVDEQRASPDEAAGSRQSETPDAVADLSRNNENAWIMQAINQLGTRIDGVENRLRRIEIRIAWAIGLAVGVGIIIGLISRVIDFSFTISIIPSP